MRKLTTTLGLCFALLVSTQAAEKVSVKFRSRAIVDVGYFSYDDYNGRVYPAINDLRLGTLVKMGDVSFKIDAGINASKVSIKDAIVNWSIDNKNNLQFGSAYEPIGIDNLSSNLDLALNTFASPTNAIGHKRRLGLTYFRNTSHHHGALGIYSDNDFNTLFTPINTSTAIAITTRQVYRIKWSDTHYMQVGAAASFRNIDQRVDYTESGKFKFASQSFVGILNQNVIELIMPHAKWNARTGIETLGTFGRVRVQGEYLWTHVARTKTLLGTRPAAFNAHGGYMQVAILLNKKGNFRYDNLLAIGVRPEVGALELAARVDYINMNCEKAQLYGGEQTNLTLGVNWYFHKLFSCKWNVNYSIAGEHIAAPFAQNGLSSTLRVQFCY